MLLKIFKNRTVSSSGTWGTKNENNYEILNFEFPEELEEYNKRIVYYLDDERVWDAIIDNKAILTNAITTKGSVKAYVWCTKSDEAFETDVDFRTQIFVMNFFENDNADGIVPTPEQVDGFNTMLTAMNAKIDEVDALEQTIGAAESQRQEAEATRVSNENTRESNESTRQNNEQTRQTQEADRERRTNEAIANIQDKTAEYNANAQAKTTDFNNNASAKKSDFNSNAESKTTTFNNNASSKTSDFNTNATNKTNAFDSNASSKTTSFNNNATSKTTDFNTNAENKTTAFNSNATDKTTNFDNNASSKTTTFNENATSKTNDFNDNATAKTTAYNENAQAKTEAFDEHTAEITADIEELQQEVEELSENMPWDTTEQATEISVDDAAKYSRNTLELFGNTEQDNTKMTYKCDGTETGDYYLTYNSIDYYFTMPTIVNGDILVFNTTDLKLYLGNTEITTESTGTGTNLTFISSPNPNYPQDIHVVTGNNSIGVQGKNLFDKNNSNIKSLNAGFPYEGTFSAATNQKHVYIKCKPNTYYVISKNFTKDWTQGIYETQVPPNVGVHAKRLYWGDFNPPVRVKTSDNANYLDVRLNTGAETTETINRILDGLQIEEGSTATDYAPYHHVYYSINLGSLELRKIGSYQDYFFKNEPNNPNYNSSLVENAWYEYKKVGKYTVTENTGLYYPSSNHVYIRTGESFIRSSASLGSYYIFENISSGFANMANWHFGLEGTGVIHLKDNRFNSPGEFTNYFREHPLDIYLPYTTAKNIQITDETLISQLDAIYEHLKLIKGTNNISITASDLKPYMELSYMQDLPSKLDNLDSRLALLE